MENNDRNCLASFPNKCGVSCLIEVGPVKDREYIVKDTFLTKEYEIIEIQLKTVIKQGGNLDWIEVVCDGDMTPKLIKRIQKALKEKKFYNGPIDGQMSRKTNNALLSFQNKNGLRECPISYETLKFMNVKF